MIEFRLPSLGADMDEGKLLQWLVRPGDRVQKGQIVCIVDTAKAAIDVECWHDGTVHALLTEPGTTIPVGTLMAVLREPGEAVEAVDAWLAQQAKAKPAPVAAAPTAAPVAAPVTAVAAAAERKRISPAARKRAAELGIDPDRVAPGADGAVSLEDVERAARPAKPAAPIDR
ncbi:MAG: E3 binding domain-containing protein, partial [Burkholderiaceae bacterium]|nr:E3 binding domain-containing protein [Burkholderiaceae bacterium]